MQVALHHEAHIVRMVGVALCADKVVQQERPICGRVRIIQSIGAGYILCSNCKIVYDRGKCPDGAVLGPCTNVNCVNGQVEVRGNCKHGQTHAHKYCYHGANGWTIGQHG